MICDGRAEIRYNYARYGYTRGGGKIWHGGQDIVALDNSQLLMAYYDGKEISGVVDAARIVTNKANKTWEWGYYVRVKLDSYQTPDDVNYLIYAHCSKLLVKKGDRVKSGDVLAIMGNTGNAALASPPYKHCHFEARKTVTGKGLDPTHYSGVPNAVGVYGKNLYNDFKAIKIKRGTWNVRKGPGTDYGIFGVLRGPLTIGFTDFTGLWYKTIYGYVSKLAVESEVKR